MATPVDIRVGLPWRNKKPTTARTASLFKNGVNQAIRLPQDLRFPDSVKEVSIRKEGNQLLISPVPTKGYWASFFATDAEVPDDYMADRDREPAQDKDLF